MSSAATLPPIIQGGMGVGVSNWRLARAVSRLGHLGVVSGSVLDTVMVRRLQDGDLGGHVRRAIERFPLPAVGEEVLRRYFRPDGRPPGAPYKLLPMYRQVVTRLRQQITMLAAFVEVSLAREGHEGIVGINLLTKVQMPNLATLYGAMLAGVDVVLMGAGIPRDIPGALDALAVHERASLRFDVDDLPADASELLTFDPADYVPDPPHALARPIFLPIVSASSLAMTLARKANGRVDGFVVEGPTAGGHNAPPRGELRLDERGEPIYGARDNVDLARMRELGLPFWLAGGYGSPERLRFARAEGAAGIQVGTLFAYSAESGYTAELKEQVLTAVVEGRVRVRTDLRASPTGFPFKIVKADGGDWAASSRERVCDLGYLRTAVRTVDGRTIYRCPAEPGGDYVGKGGADVDLEGRRCLCNGLLASIGQGQEREHGSEEPIITSGDDLVELGAFLGGRTRYSAADVVSYLSAGD